MIKAPLNLLSEKLNRLNFFISHDEAGVSGLFIILAGPSSLPDCLFGNMDPTSAESIVGLAVGAAVLTPLS